MFQHFLDRPQGMYANVRIKVKGHPATGRGGPRGSG